VLIEEIMPQSVCPFETTNVWKGCRFTPGVILIRIRMAW